MNKATLNKVLIPVGILGVVSIAFFSKKAMDSQNKFYDNRQKLSESSYTDYYDNFTKEKSNSFIDKVYAKDNLDNIYGAPNNTLNNSSNGSYRSLNDDYDKLYDGFNEDHYRANYERLDGDNLYYTKDGRLIYNINWGDTLSYISRDFGYSVDKIANLNDIRNVNLIYANSSLEIPQK